MQAVNRFIKLPAAFALETESCIEKVSKRSYSDLAFS